jgi:hypothetical protein
MLNELLKAGYDLWGVIGKINKNIQTSFKCLLDEAKMVLD